MVSVRAGELAWVLGASGSEKTSLRILSTSFSSDFLPPPRAFFPVLLEVSAGEEAAAEVAGAVAAGDCAAGVLTGAGAGAGLDGAGGLGGTIAAVCAKRVREELLEGIGLAAPAPPELRMNAAASSGTSPAACQAIDSLDRT